MLPLLFAIAQFGLLFKDVLVLHNAASEAARAGPLGEATTTITTIALYFATGLIAEDVSITQQYQLYDEQAPTGDQPALADVESENDAPAGAQIGIASVAHTA